MINNMMENNEKLNSLKIINLIYLIAQNIYYKKKEQKYNLNP